MDEHMTIEFERSGADTLRARVTGDESLATTISYWEAILERIELERPRYLLLIDELRGAPLAAGEWQQLVDCMAGRGLEVVCIAHVKPRGLDLVEYCEIYAAEAGLQARVFTDENAAMLWLRYGER